MPPDPPLRVQVISDQIIVSLPGSTYSVFYYKPDNSPQLLGRGIPRIPLNDDLSLELTAGDFLAQAWKLANAKARDLGWIV